MIYNVYIYLIMRYVTLKTEEIEALEHSSKNSNSTIRKRSHCLLLSHQGRTIIDLASIFDVDRRTIDRWFNRWEKEGLYSPELNLIEILWRRIKYQWLSFDAYLSFQNLKERLLDVLQNVGVKYDIIF